MEIYVKKEVRCSFLMFPVLKYEEEIYIFFLRCFLSPVHSLFSSPTFDLIFLLLRGWQTSFNASSVGE